MGGGARISIADDSNQPTARLPMAGDWTVGDSIAYYDQDPPRSFLYPSDLPNAMGGSAIVMPTPEDPVVVSCGVT